MKSRTGSFCLDRNSRTSNGGRLVWSARIHGSGTQITSHKVILKFKVIHQATLLQCSLDIYVINDPCRTVSDMHYCSLGFSKVRNILIQLRINKSVSIFIVLLSDANQEYKSGYQMWFYIFDHLKFNLENRM